MNILFPTTLLLLNVAQSLGAGADECTRAIELAIDTKITGSTVTANIDPNAGECGSSSRSVSPGVWHKVKGTGNLLTASTCLEDDDDDEEKNFVLSDDDEDDITTWSRDLDTQISVFNGTCDSLVCIDGDDNYCGKQSFVSWRSVVGTDYLVLVHGADSTDKGRYSLIIKDEGDRDHMRPPNNNCWNSIGLTPGADETIGDTTHATLDVIPRECGGNGLSKAPGIWYNITGTGNILQAHTCNDISHDTIITIFTGDSCDSLVCMEESDDYPGCGLQSNVIWESLPDITYYILVHGFSDSIGDFALVVDEVAPQQNEICTGAIRLDELGAPVSSTTQFFTTSYTTDCAEALQEDYPGAWYTIIGTGNTLVADVCESNLNKQISIFTGPSCTSLTCEAYTHTDCNLRWETTKGTVYLILVQDFSTVANVFTLTVEESIPPVNAKCDTATPLTLDIIVNGSTTHSFASSSEIDFCGEASFSDSPGVWFSFRHPDNEGGPVNVGTCGGAASFDTQILVFEGSCQSLSCVSGDDDTCSKGSLVRFFAKGSVDYFIYVYGYGSDENHIGDFTLIVEEIQNASNDMCTGASPVMLGTPIDVVTEVATPDHAASVSCGIHSSDVVGAGVWYTVRGTGTELAASVCIQSAAHAWDDSQYDSPIYTPIEGGFLDIYMQQHGLTSIPDHFMISEIPLNHPDFDFFDQPNSSPAMVSVFSGSSCDDLTCLENSGDGCSITWGSDPDTTYYILVQSRLIHDSSHHELVVSGPPANDRCSGAHTVKLGSINVESNELALPNNDLGYCGDSSLTDGGPGVWFQIEGTGAIFRANTCKNTMIDTQITIFEGNCDTPRCVAGNDDYCRHQSSVSWETVVNTTYYILVSSHADEHGVFTLEIEEVVPPANDKCETSEPILVGDPLVGSTALASLVESHIPECDGISGAPTPAVWFSIEGMGKRLVASTCGSSFDTQVSVFAGSCGELKCVSSNNNARSEGCETGSRAKWDAEVNQTYYILLSGYMEASGEYTLFIDDRIPANNDCVDAEALFLSDDNNDYTVSGYTNWATQDPDVADSCALNLDYSETSSPGVWYSVIGTGKQLNASLCGSDYDTQLTIFWGGCRLLTCESSNDDGPCGVASEVIWESDESVEYLIHVHGYAEEFGSYKLRVSEVINNNSTVGGGVGNNNVAGNIDSIWSRPQITSVGSGNVPDYIPGRYAPPPNDICDDATVIQPNIAEYFTSLSFAGLDSSVRICFGDNAEETPGAWFAVNGNNLEMEASTCGMSSLDTRISVFSGSCDGLVCETFNDNGDGDNCGSQSSAKWNSIEGTTYYILVSGESGTTGDFGMVVVSRGA